MNDEDWVKVFSRSKTNGKNSLKNWQLDILIKWKSGHEITQQEKARMMLDDLYKTRDRVINGVGKYTYLVTLEEVDERIAYWESKQKGL